MEPQRIIIALDTSVQEEATDLVRRLPEVEVFKVGLQLFNTAGQDAVKRVRDSGHQVFLDLKLHDIPATVAKAVQAVMPCRPRMLTVHAAGGRAMLLGAAAAASDGAARQGAEPPILLGVTMLTSLDAADMHDLRIRTELSPGDYVLALADLALSSGCNGLIVSGREVQAVRRRFPNCTIVTPGVRPPWSESGDQKRVVTPAEAMTDGADYVVVGRPVTGAEDPARAFARLMTEQ